jgi:hypothetical protein
MNFQYRKEGSNSFSTKEGYFVNNYPYEPGKQSPYGPYQAGNSPVPPPPPPSYQAGNSLPTYPQASDPYAPTFPMNSYIPPLPVVPPPVKPRGGRNKALLGIIVVVVVVVGSIVGFLAVSNAIKPSPPPAPTPVPYPAVVGAYSGLAHNITFNQDSEMAMTSVVQDAGKISGSIQFGLPLVGAGTFNGTVSRTNAIQFAITSTSAGGSLTSTFNGIIDKQGSMSGTYVISNGQKGTWKAAPNPAPLVYPLLFTNYSGNFYNNSTAKSGVMTLMIVTQNQKNFTGMFDSTNSVIGTVGTDDSIQFVGTDSKGAPITFNGTVNVDGSLNGTYRASDSVTGTWKVTPTTK